MKILLDHDIPHALRQHFPEVCVVFTAHYMGWSHLKNGALIKAASNAAFMVLITLDRKLGFQQDLANCPIGIRFLRARPVKLPNLLRLMPAIEEALPVAEAGRHVTVFV